MKKEQITWGIIGCGDVTEKKSGPAFNKVSNSQLLAVMRRDGKKAADYARRHQVPLWYDAVNQLLLNSEINAIYIATPPSSHLEYAIKALKYGKAVYIEKPVTLNADEATCLAAAVEQYQGKLVVAHYRRQLPMFLKIKEIITQGVIGDIRLVDLRLWQSRSPDLVTQDLSNWRTNPAISGGGYFFDLSPHQLDLMLYFFGKPLSYSGFSQVQNPHNNNVADQTIGTILFDHKIVFNGSWNFNVSKSDNVDTCEVIGELGSLKFSIFGNNITLKGSEGEREIFFTHPENIQHPMIDNTVNYFLGKGTNPSSIEEAVTLMQMIDTFAVVYH
ncbi:Gfo/Idh/MocA family protein [Sphingobacterium sp. UBA6320]|uniref:Gfo/Idh/MocA family protein n=1 Tax=Sphingobacterium sp. UBA6320 TaxID=1947510 RepID=UPI0025D3A97E|nr:Gfo/Idh/MocA family oxidoreductase [Sphingobacterium sp. UBA6320]